MLRRAIRVIFTQAACTCCPETQAFLFQLEDVMKYELPGLEQAGGSQVVILTVVLWVRRTAALSGLP